MQGYALLVVGHTLIRGGSLAYSDFFIKIITHLLVVLFVN